MYIGKKVKELRKIQNLTLVELAEKSGVQVATLSRIENQKMIGSLESHMAIAKALGIDVTQLYSNIVESKEKVALRAGENSNDIFVHNDRSSYEILTSKVLSKKMMPVLLKIEPGGCSNKDQGPLGSEKFVYVLEGQVEAHVDSQAYPLLEGNSLYFDASLEHWFVNNGVVAARVICVGSPVVL